MKILFLDGSLQRARVGLLRADGGIFAAQHSGHTLATLFQMVGELFRRERVSWAQLDAVLVCAGPGNLMGLRVAKMLLDVARALGFTAPAYSFCGLEWTARWILRSDGPATFHLLAPISRRRSVLLAVGGGHCGPMVCVDDYGPSAAVPCYVLPTRDFPAAPTIPAPPLPPQFLAEQLRDLAPGESFEPLVFSSEEWSCGDALNCA